MQNERLTRRREVLEMCGSAQRDGQGQHDVAVIAAIGDEGLGCWQSFEQVRHGRLSEA